VRLAWLYLRSAPLPRAIERFVGGLKRFADFHGVPGLYHETITWAFLLLIQDRLSRSPACASFADFEAANADLFEKNALRRFYCEETLASDLARRAFVFPDRVADGT
jgi:hypothetical protein